MRTEGVPIVKSPLSRPRLRPYIGVAALVITLLAVPAAPASALPAPIRELTETFEGSSANTWTFDGAAGCDFCGYVLSDSSVAHSGTKSAFIETFGFFSSFFSVGKSVHLVFGANHTCIARLYVKHIGAANIEVINPTNWTYVALRSLPGTSTSYQFQSLSWVGGPTDVYFRVSTVSDSVEPDPWTYVDDITIDCL